MDRRSVARWVLLLACVGCGKAPAGAEATVTPEAVQPKATARSAPPAREQVGCETARCYAALADARRRDGADDAAAAYLGLAHATDPTEASLRAWLDALATTGQRRRLALALAQAAAEHPTIVAEHAASAAPGLDRTVAPGEPSFAVRAALVAELDGRIDDALAGLRTSTEPADRARLGDLAWRRGERLEARRAWAAARIEIDERGGRMRVLPMERWFTEGMSWSGERLVLIRGWRPVDLTETVHATELQHWSPGERAELVRSVLVPGNTGAVLLSRDGTRLHGAAAGRLDTVELATGRVVSTPVSLPGERVGALATAGVGPRALVLVAVGSGAQLVSTDGEILDTFELKGTTPTITRVYRAGEGTRHDNILEDTPTWPVAAAVSDDGRWVAIGGSDSKVRLWDRQRGTARELAYEWSYEERRLMGGNPDLNLPLDLELVGHDRELVVAYRHGDVITWRTRDGKRLHTIRGTCSVTEATAEIHRHAPVDAPRAVPTAEQREDCGRASDARFSPDAALVATAGGSVRVRDTSKGAGVAMLVDPDLPSDMLAFGPDGRLAIADIYGRPRVWTRERGLAAPWGKGRAASGPISPHIDPSGRYLELDLRERWVVWDLEERRDVSPVQHEGEHALAVAPDGAWIVAVGPSGVQLRRRDGTVEWSRSVNDTTPSFIPGDKVVLAQYQGEVRVRELEGGHEVVLADAGSGGRVSASADGSRLVSFAYDEPLRVYDTARGQPLLVLDVRPRHAVMSPDGSWVAWLEVPDEQKPETVACWRRIADPDAPVSRISVPGWAKLLAAAPGSDELLAVTESSIVRWRPQEGWQRAIEGLEYVSANAIRYSADRRLLLFEGYDRVDVYESSDGLPRLGTLYPLLDGGWSVVSEQGALDGSETAPASMMTLVEGTTGDVLVHGGALGWDRFVVEGLWAQLLAGRRVRPPIEAAPRPVQ